MKFLILGASGMAGHTIVRYLETQGHLVTGLSRRPGFGKRHIVADVTNGDLLRGLIEAGEYDVVVNSVGLLNADADNDKPNAVALNSLLPHRLADITAEMPTRVVQMSTDCVFAGNTGPYAEDSFQDGSTFYDRSKSLGELRDNKNITLRNSIVGPDINADGIGLLNWFMRQEGSVQGYTSAYWSGVTTLELSKAIEAIAEDGTTGLVNMVPSGGISKHDLLCLFNKYLRDESVEIVPSEVPSIDKTLVRTNFDSKFVPAPYDQQVRELAEWIRKSPAEYPHYKLGARNAEEA